MPRLRKVKSFKFRRLRDAHHREKAEDYVEMVAELMTERGEARLTDIAKRFGVSLVTAHKIIDRLQREGWVRSQPYRAIFLTTKGKQLAEESRQRHTVVYRLLRSLGVPDAVAQVDAEGIEHHVSPKTLTAFAAHVRRGG